MPKLEWEQSGLFQNFSSDKSDRAFQIKPQWRCVCVCVSLIFGLTVTALEHVTSLPPLASASGIELNVTHDNIIIDLFIFT